jgi:hypothetical protein
MRKLFYLIWESTQMWLTMYTNAVNYVHKLGTMLRLEYLSLQIIPDNECHNVYNIF